MTAQAFAAAADLRRWAEDRFVPVVVTAASRPTEHSLRKNGLTFVDLLRPYERLAKDVHVRSLKEDGAYSLKGFSVRLRPLEELRNAKEDVRQKYFFQCLRQGETVDAAMERTVAKVAASPCPSFPEADLDGLRSAGLPWFEAFRQEFVASCRFNYWDTLDHPLGVIVGVTSREERFLEQFRLLEADIANPLFPVYCVDPTLARLYVLVHDLEDGPSPAAVEAMYARMREEFGPMNCKVLVVNGNRQKLQLEKRVWPHRRSPVDAFCCNDSENVPQDLGPVGLTEDELAAVRAVMQDFLELGLLAHMDRKLRSLHAIVNTRSRGKLNKMLQWFGAGKADTPQQDASEKFLLDSYEMQVRKVADLLFLLRDYGQAMSFYKQLKTELSSATNPSPMSLPYLASCHEAIALCMWLQGRGNPPPVSAPAQTLSAIGLVAARKDSESSFDQALSLYLRCQRADYAYRVSLFSYALARARQTPMRGAEVTLRAATLDDRRSLYAALFLEQTALCHLTSPNGCYHRKFAFYMVLAALKYSQNGLGTQAIRCNRIAALLYPGKRWGQIQDHLNNTLGRLYDEAASVSLSPEDMLKAIGYTKRFMQFCSQPELKQESLLQQFCQQWTAYLHRTGRARIHRCHLPLVDTSPGQARVLTNALGYRGALSPNLALQDTDFPEAEDADHPAWKALQGLALERRALHPACTAQSSAAVVGEAVEVALPITNPLNIPLFINDLALGVEFVPGEGGTGAGPPYTSSPIQRLHFAQNETRMVRLQLTPHAVGTLRLQHVEWTLCGLVRGSRAFGAPPPDIREDDEEAPSQPTSAPPPNPAAPRLAVAVTPPMPALACSLSPTPPAHLLHGEIFRTALVLQNTGSVPMAGIRVAFTDPAFLTFAECSGHAPNFYDLEPSRLLELPVTVAPGQEITVPAFLRGAFEGDHTVRIVVVFSDPSLKSFRVCHSRIQMQVRPCLRLRAYCLPGCPVARPEGEHSPYLMVLEVHNCRREPRFSRNLPLSVLQLSTLSRHWEAVPLNVQLLRTDQPLALHGNQSFVVFFKLRFIGPDGGGGPGAANGSLGVAEAVHLSVLRAAEAQDPQLGAALRELAAEGAEEDSPASPAAFDTTRWPFAHFLFNTPPAPLPAVPIRSQPTSPLSLASPIPLSPVPRPPAMPLTFLCQWASAAQDRHVGMTYLTTLPTEWNQGWALTSLELPGSLAQLLLPQPVGFAGLLPASPKASQGTSPATPRGTSVSCTLQYPPSIPWTCPAVSSAGAAPFALCEAGVTLVVTNDTAEPQALQVVLHQTALGYRWLGKLKHQLPDLGPGATHAVPLRVGFTACGVHDLSAFSVLFSQTKGPAALAPSHYFCRVEDARQPA